MITSASANSCSFPNSACGNRSRRGRFRPASTSERSVADHPSRSDVIPLEKQADKLDFALSAVFTRAVHILKAVRDPHLFNDAFHIRLETVAGYEQEHAFSAPRAGRASALRPDTARRALPASLQVEIGAAVRSPARACSDASGTTLSHISLSNRPRLSNIRCCCASTAVQALFAQLIERAVIGGN